MVKKFKSFKKESLKTLTLKFIDYIFENNFKTVLNLEKITEKLNIKKRRLYDLTNVLEGIGYLKKYKRNIMEITPEFFRQILSLKAMQIIKLENILIQEKDLNYVNFSIQYKENEENNQQKNEKDLNGANFLIQNPENEEDINFKVAYEQVFNNLN